MLCSTTTRAAGYFLQEELNGHFHKPASISSLEQAMMKFINASDSELIKMGENSTKMAENITPASWSNTLIEFMNQN